MGGRRTRQAILALVIVLEVTPANLAIRGGVLGASQVGDGRVLAGALAFGLSTLVIEVLCVVLLAVFLDADRIGTSFVHEVSGEQPGRAGRAWRRLEERMEGHRPSRWSALSLSVVSGAALSALLLTTLDPPSSKERQLRVGLASATFLASVAAVQGALVGWGIAAAGLVAGLAVAVLAASVPLLLGGLSATVQQRSARRLTSTAVAMDPVPGRQW